MRFPEGNESAAKVGHDFNATAHHLGLAFLAGPDLGPPLALVDGDRDGLCHLAH